MEGSSKYWLPENISTHGAGIDQLINILHWFMLALFIGWGIFFVYCLIRFRERPGHQATPHVKHFKLPTYLEIGVAIFEVVLLIFLSYPIWKATKADFPPEEESVMVRVVGEQFAWTFHYAGKDGKFGRTDPELIDAEDNPVGVDREDPAGIDDIVSMGELHIPVDKPVIVHLTSKDVIHSFWIPVLRAKHDAIPGSVFPMWFQATKTGTYDITCAQLCGVGHTTMKAAVVIHDQSEYQGWLDEQHEELMEEYGDEA